MDLRLYSPRPVGCSRSPMLGWHLRVAGLSLALFKLLFLLFVQAFSQKPGW